ncbi:MAG: SDR family oxidoreductase [Myxococcota bacterium]|nr:SDR family oxidoreductase [Myxococcota bacterium]
MSAPLRFAGRTALVTGAASGSGRATARRLGAEGAAVAAVDRDGPGAEATAAALGEAGGRGAGFACDVSESAAVGELAARAEAELGVRLNAICPGGVDTPMIRAGGPRRAPDEAEAEARRGRVAAYQYFMPIKRLSSPEEQAAAIAFLASDEASYINGVALDVNGGLFMA